LEVSFIKPDKQLVSVRHTDLLYHAACNRPDGWRLESKVSRNGRLISTSSHYPIAIFIHIPFPTLLILIPILTKFLWKKWKTGMSDADL